MKKALLFLATLIIISSFVSALECGDTITEDTILTNDLLNCLKTGLVIGANDITLDCNDYLITGTATDISGYSGIFATYKNKITIKNCNISGFFNGIYFYSSFNNILTNNIVSNNKFYGINLRDSSNNTLSNNIAKYNRRDGIYSYPSSNNILINNIASNNGNCGIRLREGSNNILSNNIANDNGRNGLSLYANSNNALTNNIFNNNLNGILLYLNCNNNILSDNDASNNGRINGISGIGLYYSNNNTISGNNFMENRWYGAQLYNSSYNTFWNNNFIDNGIYNAYEKSNSNNNNNWNYSNIGNYWSDFKTNSGYPEYYIISGSGDGIDWHPLIPDQDNDEVPNDEDKCPNTIGEQIVYGCSCNQILELKPGKDKSSKCSPGIIKVFTKQIGWAKDLF